MGAVLRGRDLLRCEGEYRGFSEASSATARSASAAPRVGIGEIDATDGASPGWGSRLESQPLFANSGAGVIGQAT